MIKPIPTPLDPEEEHLKVPANLMEDLDLEYTNSAEGLVISGMYYIIEQITASCVSLSCIIFRKKNINIDYEHV